MQRLLDSFGGIDLPDLHHPDVFERTLTSTWTPRLVQIHAHTAQLHDRCARGLTPTGANFHGSLAQHWPLGHALAQMLRLSRQAPVLASADHKVHSVLLIALEGLITIGFTIPDKDPVRALRWPTGALERR